jgi:hypothetical protein
VTCSIATLIDEACASGFKCLDENQFRALVLQLLCNISAGGGGSAGLAQAFAGSGPPTTQIPAFSAGTYYDYTNSVIYHWNPTLNAGTGGWE